VVYAPQSRMNGKKEKDNYFLKFEDSIHISYMATFSGQKSASYLMTLLLS
jgi:hypothetical protein